MLEYGKYPAVVPPACARPCVVLACRDAQEAEQVGRALLKVNMCVQVTYGRLEDFMLNPPLHQVTVAILATNDPPELTGQALAWIRNRWPRCCIAVVADAGKGASELTARMGGANFLARPVTDDEWAGLFSRLDLGNNKERVFRKNSHCGK